MYIPNRIKDDVRRGVFHDESISTSAERHHNVVLFSKGRDHESLYAGLSTSNPTYRFETTHAGHAEVHEYNIRHQTRTCLYRFCSIPRLSQHTHIDRCIDYPPQCLTYQLFIIGN